MSIPDINADVSRRPNIKMRYFDEDFNEFIGTFSGMTARVIQHEYDHIEGKLFTDYLKPLKKRLLKRKLTKITKGQIDPRYRMKFPR